GSSIAEKHVVNVSIQVPLPHKEETLRILFAMKIHMRFPWSGWEDGETPRQTQSAHPGYGCAFSNPARCAAFAATIAAVSVTFFGVVSRSLKSTDPIASPTQ
ncbi:MAG: hypothetical protein JWL96_1231, partial [Sphingomonas bacterium]|nr:hypothetical protein [Sphingomonas bacterium]